MAAGDLPVIWQNSGVAQSISTLTNLHSLADGNIWQSALQSGVPAEVLRLWFDLHLDTPGDGDYVNIYLANGSQAGSNEIWPAGIGESEAEISTAANILDVQEMLVPIATRRYVTNATDVLQFEVIVPYPGDDWIVLVEVVGCGLDPSGNDVQYLYGMHQYQSS